MDGNATEEDPSAMVVLVREFLSRELRRLNTPIRIVTTGPSPFHADFDIRPKSGLSSDLEHSWHDPGAGYDRVTFYYDPDVTHSEAAYEAITRSLLDPFSMYYEIVRDHDQRMAKAMTVANMANNLIAVHRRKGIRGWFFKTMRSGSQARELLLDAITAKQSDMERRARLRSQLTRRDRGIALPDLSRICQQEIDEDFEDSLTTSENVARTLEGGRVLQYQVFVAASATIFGAFGGAITSLIVR
ncbi:hypothetical protein [Mycobacterium sp. 1081908.1]|uniref:hypothetical protein n=1 Tax=Mycobacterium sp. 1081908.1 TaxID=1834066 RepID=UPI0012EA2A9E|nr:hypothetical protein [Mycobacterium sp. 1081908.1]